MPPFRPLFRNPHLQTIAGHFWRRRCGTRVPERRFYETEAGAEVLLESYEPGRPVGQLVLVHGLESSGAAGYMRSLSAAAVELGFAAHCFNMRTCGGTEQRNRTLYHAGLTSDLATVLRNLRAMWTGPVFLVGFSLGGNVVLKLAGELGPAARELFDGVCTVSAPLDLEACARRIAEPQNRLYERRFVRRMRARLCATGRYSAQDFDGLDSLNAIDERITSRSFGFSDAAHYYRTQSAIHFLTAVRVPALLIQARDDTFIPFDVYNSAQVRENPAIEFLITPNGGHLGFIGRKPNRFWIDDAIMEWIRQKMVAISR